MVDVQLLSFDIQTMSYNGCNKDIIIPKCSSLFS